MEPYKYMDFLETYFQRTRLERTPCTPEEVAQIEKDWGVKLPLAYRELYLINGKYGAFAFPDANSYQFDEFGAMQEAAREAAKEADSGLMEDNNNFVFAFFDQHSISWFFRLNEGENPPVYKCDESGDIEKITDSLSDFVKMQGWYKLYLIRTGQH